jgi:FkbM family methyltransferase
MKLVKDWYLPSNDVSFEPYITKEGYQHLQRKKILDFIKSKKKKLNNCIDVGSHVGFWTKELALNFNHVFCFEPIADVRECFYRNVSNNNLTLFPFGLGSENKKINVLYDPKNTGQTHADVKGNIEIEIKKLDDYQLQINKIDFIKIDSEGYELEVIKGASKIIERDKPFINLEIKNKVLIKQNLNTQDIQKYMQSINYKLSLITVFEYLFEAK